jgi:hypothetical protein
MKAQQLLLSLEPTAFSSNVNFTDVPDCVACLSGGDSLAKKDQMYVEAVRECCPKRDSGSLINNHSADLLSVSG